jgi:hypothetical protein
MKQYYQCRLRRYSSDLVGWRETTAWIEASGAKAGAIIELLPSHENWLVDAVFKTFPLPEAALKEHQLLNRHSLPSVEGMG